MDPRSAAGAYREAAFENAPPIKIVRMLYAGALRFLDQAAQETPGGPGSRWAVLLSRTDAVVAELRCSLDKNVAPDVAESLEQLYLFIEDRLREAQRTQDPEQVASARKVLVTLQQAWNQVEASSRGA
jgi:flagellar protein FliS